MMEAYVDESGTDAASPVMCIAGYLFDASQAAHLDREWSDALKEFNLPHFHAVDCAHGVREFSNLDPRQRIQLVIKLTGIIRRRATIGIAVSVSDTDFGQTPAPIWERGGPYVLCAAQVLMAVIAWADKREYHGKISYVFEKGHRHRALTDMVIKEICGDIAELEGLRCHSHAFAAKPEMRPLQAADLLAYEWTKEMKRLNCTPPASRAMRRSLETLLDVPHYQQHFGATQIYEMFQHDRNALLRHMRAFTEVE